jgi:glycerol-3-phosphate dehydrogenase (NAD(P)+)
MEKSGAQVAVWDIVPELATLTPEEVDAAIAKSDAIFLCLCSKDVRAAAERIRPLKKVGAPVLTLAKGMEQGTVLFMHEVLGQCLPTEDIGLLVGPFIAAEVRAGLPTCAVCAGSEEVFTRVLPLFAGSAVRLRDTQDLAGAGVLSVLKNIYALLLGIAEALELGANVRGFLMAEAVNEMKRIVTHIGGLPETTQGLAGLGDMVTTASSPLSYNTQVAHLIARGVWEKSSEGVRSAPLLATRLGDTEQFPLFNALLRILNQENDPHSEIVALFSKK